MAEQMKSRMRDDASVRRIVGLAVAGLAAAAGLLAVFALFASELAGNELEKFDLAAGDWIRLPSAAWLRTIAIVITWLGSGYADAVVLLIFAGYLIRRHKQWAEPAALTAGLLGAWLLNTWLKSVFRRSRPDIQHLVEAGGYSFPSGHAMVSAFFYGMLGYLLWSRLRRRGAPAWPVPYLTALLVLAIGVSRVYLGVHFASDVLAGFAAGGAWLIACIGVLHAYKHRYKRD